MGDMGMIIGDELHDDFVPDDVRIERSRTQEIQEPEQGGQSAKSLFEYLEQVNPEYNNPIPEYLCQYVRFPLEIGNSETGTSECIVPKTQKPRIHRYLRPMSRVFQVKVNDLLSTLQTIRENAELEAGYINSSSVISKSQKEVMNELLEFLPFRADEIEKMVFDRQVRTRLYEWHVGELENFLEEAEYLIKLHRHFIRDVVVQFPMIKAGRVLYFRTQWRRYNSGSEDSRDEEGGTTSTRKPRKSLSQTSIVDRFNRCLSIENLECTTSADVLHTIPEEEVKRKNFVLPRLIIPNSNV
jgi:hypothetical protein